MCSRTCNVRFINVFHARIARLIFLNKAKPSVKKGKKQPTKLLKIAKHFKAKKVPNPSFDYAKIIEICLLTTQINIEIHLVYSQHLHKEQLLQNYF